MTDNEKDIDDLMCWLSSPPAHDWDEKPSEQDRYYRALDALIAERDALQAKVKEHAEDRRKYIDAWADWIEANAGLEIDQWLRVYADAVPSPSPDGDEAKQRIFKHLDQRMRDASDAIDALRKRVAELESQPPADRDRDLLERLVCAALTGLMSHPSDSHPMHNLREVAVYSATAADLTLAAMRKGESDGK